MALQSASISVRPGGNTAKVHQKASSTSASSISSGPVPPPAAVQNMLKITTELGDVSRLVHVRRHISNSGSRLQSTRLRSDSFDSSFASALRHRRMPRNRPVHNHKRLNGTALDSRLNRQDTVRTDYSLRPYDPYMRQSNSDLQSNRLQIREYHRVPLRPSHNNRSWTTLESYDNTKSRNSHSSSRLSTRADSRYNKTMLSKQDCDGLGHSRRVYPFHASRRNSAASSPASRATLAGVGAFRYNTNLSNSFSMRLSSPASASSYSDNAHPLDTSNVIDNSRNGYGIGRADHGGLLRGMPSCGLSNPTRTPHYYDYSESFMEEECFSPGLHVLELICPNDLDQTIMNSNLTTATSQQTQTTSMIRIGSPLFPAELPTLHNNRTSELGLLSQGTNESSAVAHLERTDQAIDIAELPTNDNNDRETRIAVKEPFELEATNGNFSSISRLTRASSGSGIFFLSRDRSQRDLTALAARLHFLGTDRKYKNDPAASHDISTSSRLKTERLQPPREPALDDGLPDPARLSRPRTLPPCPSQRSSKMIFLRPERPISSQSRRKLQQQFDTADSRNFRQGEIHNDTHALARSSLGVTTVLKQNEQNLVHQRAEGLDDTRKACNEVESSGTPSTQKDNHSSVTTSNCRSTVESLLDKHIESLGLLPESDTSSAYSDSVGIGHFASKCYSGNQTKTSEDPLAFFVARCSQMPSHVESSPSSSTRMKLKPRKLFASMDGRITAFSEPLWSSMIPIPAIMPDSENLSSYGWQILPSTDQSVSIGALSRPTVSSGAMADIDTDVYPLGRRVWRLSQLSLPTTLEERVQEIPEGHDVCKHRRNRSVSIARKESHRHRRIRVHLKQQSGPLLSHHPPVVGSRTDTSESGSRCDQQQFFDIADYAEFNGDQPASNKLACTISVREKAELCEPKRWSDITAAMPLSSTSIPMPSRKISVRTQCSQRSQNSQTGVIHPLNSTRQRSQVPHPSKNTTAQAKPKVGPAPNASTLHLSIPYAEVPSTIIPSLHETRSFFDDSPPPVQGLRRSIRRQFGLRPLKNVVKGSRVSSLPVTARLPMRDGIPIAAVGSSLPARINSRPSFNASKLDSGFASTSNFTYGKKSVVKRFKN